MIARPNHACVRPDKESDAAFGNGGLRVTAGRRQASSGQEQEVDAAEAAIPGEDEADEWLCEPCEEKVPGSREATT